MATVEAIATATRLHIIREKIRLLAEQGLHILVNDEAKTADVQMARTDFFSLDEAKFNKLAHAAVEIGFELESLGYTTTFTSLGRSFSYNELRRMNE